MSAKKLRRDCTSNEVCRDLQKLLKKFRVPKDRIGSTCPESVELVWPCASMLSNVRNLYASISPSNASEVLDFITPLFAQRSQLISDRFRQYAGEPPFHCPELDVDMYQPCLVASCAFHTPNPWELNCILFYRLRHERDILSLNELAFLLENDVGSLRSNLNRIFRRLSYIALKETITRENVSDLVLRVHPENVCVVCERRIESKRHMVVKSGFNYCDKVCSSYKPPNIIRLEQEFMLPIEYILDLCVSRFSNVKNMCAALGVGPSVFMEWCKRYSIEIPSGKLPR